MMEQDMSGTKTRKIALPCPCSPCLFQCYAKIQLIFGTVLTNNNTLQMMMS